MNLILEKVDYSNKQHLLFLKELMKSSDMDYLWDISDENLVLNNNDGRFIVVNSEKEKVGYINISDETDAYFGKTVSVYYAIIESKRGKHYGTMVMNQITNYLFYDRNIDCIVAQVDLRNKGSQKVLINNGYNKLYEDSKDYKFYRLKKNAS